MLLAETAFAKPARNDRAAPNQRECQQTPVRRLMDDKYFWPVRERRAMTDARELTRREALRLSVAAFNPVSPGISKQHSTPNATVCRRSGISYPSDFKHFEYVNPDAPKGGVFSHVGASRIFN